jgi:hypothetical protein
MHGELVSALRYEAAGFVAGAVAPCDCVGFGSFRAFAAACAQAGMSMVTVVPRPGLLS